MQINTDENTVKLNEIMLILYKYNMKNQLCEMEGKINFFVL